MGEGNKRRRLRSSDEPSSVSDSAKLYNFDNPNDLLYKDQRITLDASADAPAFPKYAYYNERSQLPTLPKKDVQITSLPSVLPRRRKLKTDPLDDEVYGVFHRRMMKDERSCTAADKSRIMFEMDNLRNQYGLLQQHDWAKHLPSVTRVKDRTDPEELQRKRKLTLVEIKKTLEKYSNWEARNSALMAEIKSFESGKLKASLDLDADEAGSILNSTDQILKKRRRERARRDGFCFRLRLGNGFDIVSNPYSLQSVSIKASVPTHAGI